VPQKFQAKQNISLRRGFITGHAVVNITKKGNEIILHKKGAMKLTENANIQKAMAMHRTKASGRWQHW